MSRARRTNLPSNPYAGEVATAPRLQDREGWPFAAPRKPISTKPAPPAGMTDREQFVWQLGYDAAVEASGRG